MKREESIEKLDKVFTALANDQRRGMIHMLAYRPATISQLAEPFGLSLPAIHKHIKLLLDADLIRSKKAGRSNYIALNPDTLGLPKEWLSRYQTHWGSRHETLENYIASLPN
jgi:DNA-binding transcriptional ArsR family regulator